MYEIGVGCAAFAAQKFKTKNSEWTTLHTEYTADAVVNAPTNFSNFREYMKEANDAITSAGIDGIETITEGPDEASIADFGDRNQKLGSFTEKIHGEVETYVDDPFVSNMDALKTRLDATCLIAITCDDGMATLDYKTATPEEIRKFFEGMLAQYDLDSHLTTGSEDVDKYIRQFERFDSSAHQYGYETMIANWQHLDSNQREALRHYYEYNVRLMERYMDPNSFEGKMARKRVSEMQKYFCGVNETDGSYYVTTTGKDMLSLMNPNTAHSYEILTIINSFNGTANVTFPDGQPLASGTEILPSLNLDYDKAGLKLTLTVRNSVLDLSNTYDVGYFSSDISRYSFIRTQEKNSPGCYDAIYQTGKGQDFIASLYAHADNSTDINYIHNMAVSNANCDKLFSTSPEDLSRSSSIALAEYIEALSGANKADDIKEYLTNKGGQYSGAYYNMYCEGQLYSDNISVDSQGIRYGLVNPSFIEIYELDANGNKLPNPGYGGDQHWLDEYNIYDNGCGAVAAVNQYLYLTKQTSIEKSAYLDLLRGFATAEDFEGWGHIQRDQAMSRQWALASPAGALPSQIETYVTQQCAGAAIPVSISTNWDYIDDYEEDYLSMKEQLAEGIPVIWAVHDWYNCFVGNDTLMVEEYRGNGSYTGKQKISSHYMTVTAIYENIDSNGNLTRRVEVSSGGDKPLYIDYDKYMDFVSGNPLNQPCSSITHTVIYDN